MLVERLTTRATNPYGKDPAEVAETPGYLETVTTVPVGQVADIVVAHCL